MTPRHPDAAALLAALDAAEAARQDEALAREQADVAIAQLRMAVRDGGPLPSLDACDVWRHSAADLSRRLEALRSLTPEARTDATLGREGDAAVQALAEVNGLIAPGQPLQRELRAFARGVVQLYAAAAFPVDALTTRL